MEILVAVGILALVLALWLRRRSSRSVGEFPPHMTPVQINLYRGSQQEVRKIESRLWRNRAALKQARKRLDDLEGQHYGYRYVAREERIISIYDRLVSSDEALLETRKRQMQEMLAVPVPAVEQDPQLLASPVVSAWMPGPQAQLLAHQRRQDGLAWDQGIHPRQIAARQAVVYAAPVQATRDLGTMPARQAVSNPVQAQPVVIPEGFESMAQGVTYMRLTYPAFMADRAAFKSMLVAARQDLDDSSADKQLAIEKLSQDYPEVLGDAHAHHVFWALWLSPREE